MDRNFKITIEYDGTRFFGWQRQKKQQTVQEEIETVLSCILNQQITISGSGRTDSGVHAYGQTASFRASTLFDAEKIKTAANALLKRYPIVIKECWTAADDFHAQYNALSKEYHYYILNRKTPMAINRDYHWHIKEELDVDVMNRCCSRACGRLDFKSFENTGSPRTSTIREVISFTAEKIEDDRILFKICGKGFLKYMVRNLVGTIVLAGRHKISVDRFVKIIESKDRTKAGPTAPPHGLFLMRVNY